MSVTDRVVTYLKAGRPLTHWTARKTFKVDLQRLLWNLRIRGMKFEIRRTAAVNKYTGQPHVVTEYWLKEGSGDKAKVESADTAVGV